MPKVYGAIHHGGSGTTHLVLKYGCASLIIPHIIDQYVWSKIIYNLGAGPKGISMNKLKKDTFEKRSLELSNNLTYKKAAERIALQMSKENFQQEIYQTIIE